MVIGLLTRPHGIKGEVCVQYYADSPYLLKAPLFLVSPDDDIIDVKITSTKGQNDSYILKIDCINNRDEAENYRDYELCIEPPVMQEYLRRGSQSSHQNKDSQDVFVYELTDCTVYTAPDGNDDNEDKQELLGILKYVDFMAGQEIWRIYTAEEKEILFPAVPQFVAEIDIAEKKIIITPPEGLLDIYLADEEESVKEQKPKKRYKKSPKTS